MLVIGGGSAGVAAAVAAARAGARTLLVERYGLLGGMASAAFVHSICGLYLLRAEPGAVLANRGFATEFATRLIREGGAWGPQRMGRVDVLLQHPTAFALLCDRLVRETANLDVWLHTEVTRMQGTGRIDRVETICRGEARVIEPACVVDASGDAVTAPLLGAAAEMAPGDRLQRPAYIVALRGVDPQAVERDGRLRIAAEMARAVRDGLLPRGVLGAHFRAVGDGGDVFLTIDLDPPAGAAYDPTRGRSLSMIELSGRELAAAIAAFLRDRVSGFEASSIAALPVRAGIRESRRLVGRYRLEAEDLLESREFDDSIGLATWPMELRETTTGPRLRFPRADRPCGIPLRTLQARDLDNLFMAGRCLSASHEAQASIRVMGTCFVTGEAAGLASALQARGEAVTAAAVSEARRRFMFPHESPAAATAGGAAA